MAKTHKILVMHFKYLGDSVLIIPAIFELRKHYPKSKIYLLIPQEFIPVFEHQEIIDCIVGLPRKRGTMNIFELFPYIKNLFGEHFDISIDFGGNDRGALLSLFIGAKKRFSIVSGELNLIKKLGYTDPIYLKNTYASWVMMHLNFVSQICNLAIPNKPKLSVISDISLSSPAEEILKSHDIICHIGTSQPKKEWPISKWFELYKLAKKHGYLLAFSSGTNHREYDLLDQLKKLDPDIYILPKAQDLRFFIATLNQAKVVISGDTGPLHIASGLGKKIIALLAVDDSIKNCSKIYTKNDLILGSKCKCTGDLVHYVTCQNKSSCMNSITVKSVFDLLVKKYKKTK